MNKQMQYRCSIEGPPLGRNIPLFLPNSGPNHANVTIKRAMYACIASLVYSDFIVFSQTNQHFLWIAWACLLAGFQQLGACFCCQCLHSGAFNNKDAFKHSWANHAFTRMQSIPLSFPLYRKTHAFWQQASQTHKKQSQSVYPVGLFMGGPPEIYGIDSVAAEIQL